MRTYQIFLADDHQLFLEGIIKLVRDLPGFEVLGFASDGNEAYSRIISSDPDIVLLDIDMPLLNGLVLLDKLRKYGFRGRINMLSQFDESSVVEKARKSGADGYLLKSSDKQIFSEALKQVSLGKNWFPKEMSRSPRIPLSQNILASTELTDRETEILKLIANGFSNKEIGEKLFISHKTVDVHRTNLMKKLGVNNVAALVRLAFQEGLID